LAIEPTPEEREPHKLLCGLAGTEFLSFTPASIAGAGDRLTFQANHAAFAPVFPLLGSGNSSGEPLLKDDLLTAWARPKGETGNPAPVYFSQPQEAGLFEPAAGTTDGVLAVFDAPAARFTAAATAPFFPMAPYAGVDPAGSGSFPPTYVRGFEQQILTPVRRAAIAAMPVAPQRLATAGFARTTTTPQGLLARVDDLAWKSVLVAKSPDAEQPDLEFLD